jgi:tripartite-type tricarboxylate transporter receptor subunit TctC
MRTKERMMKFKWSRVPGSLWMVLWAALLISMAMAADVRAQGATKQFPSGPVKIVIAQGAGGSNDVIIRAFQPFFSKYLGVPVVIDNVEGAGGKIGRTQVYKAKPDGYTLILGGMPSAYLGQKLGQVDYLFEKMTPIYNMTGGDYNGAAVPFDSPIKTLDDLKKFGQTKNIKVGGSGIGNNAHLSFFFLKSRAGIRCTYVPYDSSTAGALAVVSKEVDACTGSLVAFSPLAAQKRIRVILTFGPKRSPSFPDIPTLVELGYPNTGYDIVLGLYGPPGIPADVVQILGTAAAKALAEPTFKEWAKKLDFTIVPFGTAEMKMMIEEQKKMVDEIVPEMIEALKAGKKK